MTARHADVKGCPRADPNCMVHDVDKTYVDYHMKVTIKAKITMKVNMNVKINMKRNVIGDQEQQQQQQQQQQP